MAKARKAIPATRDKMQSDLLVGAVAALITMKAGVTVWALGSIGNWRIAVPHWFWVACFISAGFALLVWLLRSATGPAAVLGAIICLDILLAQRRSIGWQHTAMPALTALFIMTFAATRFGRRRKQRMGTAEPKYGRRASQIVANLGVAGLCAGAASPLLSAACIAALAEATADTVSSEMGQALNGRTLLITSLREVPAGTDGGISIAGTTLGAVAAGIIVLVAAATGSLSWQNSMAAFLAGIGGLLFDSYLGATVERRGWLGNDLVNFTSTALAANLAFMGAHWLATR